MGEPNVWKDARPPLVVALVTTVDREGRPNASPKSWWTPTSYDPPKMVMALQPGSDTAKNIDQTGTWILHLPTVDVARKVLHTAKKLPHGECELDDVGLPWVWKEHKMLPHPLPLIDGMPWFICWVMSRFVSGDHVVFEGQVGIAGGFEPTLGIPDVLLHRGRNRFVELGDEFDVEPY